MSLVPRRDVFPAGVKGIKEGFLEAMTFQLAIGGLDRVQGSHLDLPGESQGHRKERIKQQLQQQEGSGGKPGSSMSPTGQAFGDCVTHYSWIPGPS